MTSRAQKRQRYMKRVGSGQTRKKHLRKFGTTPSFASVFGAPAVAKSAAARKDSK